MQELVSGKFLDHQRSLLNGSPFLDYGLGGGVQAGEIIPCTVLLNGLSVNNGEATLSKVLLNWYKN